MSLKAYFVASCYVWVMLLGSSAAAEDLQIYLKTSPALEFLRPFADPVNISLLVTHTDGRPVQQGKLAIVLEAPKSGGFLSTDFPAVEGRRLLELVLPLRQGRVEWKYLFPIRGEYRLSVVLVAAEGRTQAKNFVIPILESRIKWLWLGLFCAALFVFGFAAGRVFTGVPAAVAALFLFLSLSPASVGLGHDGPLSGGNAVDSSTALEIAAATVGTPTRLHWHGAGDGAPPTRLSLSIFHLEKRKTVFAIDKVPVTADYALEFNFPDGAEYRVNAVAEIAGREPVRAEQLVAVAGVEPPMTAQIPALVIFLAVIALGLGAGRMSKTLVAR